MKYIATTFLAGCLIVAAFVLFSHPKQVEILPEIKAMDAKQAGQFVEFCESRGGEAKFRQEGPDVIGTCYRVSN